MAAFFLNRNLTQEEVLFAMSTFILVFGNKRKPTKLRVTNNERKLTKFSEHLKCVNAFLLCLENRFVDYYRVVCGFYGSLTFSGSRQLMTTKKSVVNLFLKINNITNASFQTLSNSKSYQNMKKTAYK